MIFSCNFPVQPPIFHDTPLVNFPLAEAEVGPYMKDNSNVVSRGCSTEQSPL